MKLGPFTRAGRRRADADAVLTAYSTWRRECARVRAAYCHWARATTSDARSAFAAYRTALEDEERAAARYAQLLPRAQLLPEIDLAMQLAQPPASFGAT